ncbi:MAG: hypothetical protein ACXW3N_13565, partial [Rhodoplanes sp.]
MDADVCLAGHQLQRFAALQAGHNGHLTLHRETPRPSGTLFLFRHFKTSGCGSNYRSRMSHLTVPHP